jgi:hypothetical protein
MKLLKLLLTTMSAMLSPRQERKRKQASAGALTTATTQMTPTEMLAVPSSDGMTCAHYAAAGGHQVTGCVRVALC